MGQIITVIAPLFLIIFASAILQYFKLIGDDWSQVLNDYALKIGFPVLIFSSLSKASFSFSEQAPLLISNSIFIIISFILAYIVGKIFRFNKQMLKTTFICLAFGNVAYLGIPVLTQIKGAAILPIASLIVAIYLFWLFTIGIGFIDFENQGSKKELFKNILTNLVKNPLLIAVVLGLLMASFGIKLPGIVTTSLDMVTASVTPTVLIVIGLFIGKSKLGKITEWIPVLLFSMVKIAILPAGFYFGLKFLGYSTPDYSPSLIQAAMPLAITPFALADKYKLDKEFIARVIVLSTILAVVTLPLWISIV